MAILLLQKKRKLLFFLCLASFLIVGLVQYDWTNRTKCINKKYFHQKTGKLIANSSCSNRRWFSIARLLPSWEVSSGEYNVESSSVPDSIEDVIDPRIQDLKGSESKLESIQGDTDNAFKTSSSLNNVNNNNAAARSLASSTLNSESHILLSKLTTTNLLQNNNEESGIKLKTELNNHQQRESISTVQILSAANNNQAGNVFKSDPHQVTQSGVFSSTALTTPAKNSTVHLYNSVIPDISCDKLGWGDKFEVQKGTQYQKTHNKTIQTTQEFINSFTECSQYMTERGYITKPISKEEEEFPLAYSLLIFKDIEQIEELLRAIYRPQNYYCVHVDNKSAPLFHEAVKKLVSCFDNVFLAPQKYDVQWGMFSIIEPELECMKALLQYKKWKYFINLTGQEFPLKTNWQIVEILKIFNGANNLEGTVKRRNKDRVHPRLPLPPVNVTLTKGSVHIIGSRAFIDYIVNDERSIKFRGWVNDTYVSDETYFSSLNHSPQLGVPGAYLGVPETDTNKNLFMTRFKNWGDGPFNWPCGGQRVRQVCIFGIRDLPLLYTRPEIFANKFYPDYEPLTLYCVRRRLHELVKQEIQTGKTYIDKKFYEDLDFVKNSNRISYTSQQ